MGNYLSHSQEVREIHEQDGQNAILSSKGIEQVCRKPAESESIGIVSGYSGLDNKTFSVFNDVC